MKPSFFTNLELSRLHLGARLLFQGLWLLADREGRLKDSPEWIKAIVFPYERHPVDRWLGDLAGSGFIVRYKSQGFGYIQVVNFLKHQSPHVNESESTIPAPEQHGTDTIPLSPSIERGNQQSGNGFRNQSAGAQKFEPPTVEAVAAYCSERGNTVDAEAFVAFYASKGWKVGKNSMKDWKSAVITWEKNHGQFSKQQTPPRPRAIRDIT